MNRKITIATLGFMVVVILLTVWSFNNINKDDRRQALEASCRLFALMAEHGVGEAELVELALEEGYVLDIRIVNSDAPRASGQNTHTVALGDGTREVVVTGKAVTLLLSPKGAPARLLILCMLLAAIVFSLLMAQSILQPIKELTKVSKEIAIGHYDKRVRVRTRDEFGELEHQFNAMAAQLQETIEKLNYNSAEMESIINAMRNGLIAVDEQMHVIRLNPIASRMFEVHGDPYGKYVLDVTRNAKLESHLAAAMEQGDMYTADLPVRITRENRILRLYITGLVQDNESIGAVALIEDITELRRLENMRVDFVANVTHELKTPLTSIRGFVETLQQGAIEDHDAAMRFLSIISIEAERLTRLIDDVLSLSSLESGRKREVLEAIALAPFARQICELLQPSAREKNVELRMEDNSRDARVIATDDKLKQLLINLIDNAIKYTPDDGHVLVTLDVDKDDLVFKVKDDGIGIEGEHIPRLFERFYRVDKGRSRSMGGTGLGLAIVKHILIEMDGSINVESAYGEGTSFIVRLPIAKEAQDEGRTDAG